MTDDEFLFKDETQKIIGCAMKVANSLGAGFLEAVYQEAMEIELQKEKMPFVSQQSISIYYHGVELKKRYIADLIINNQIILELKSTNRLTKEDESQILNYLKATGIQVGILLNFGNPRKLEWKRMIYTNTTYLKRHNLPEETISEL